MAQAKKPTIGMDIEFALETSPGQRFNYSNLRISGSGDFGIDGSGGCLELRAHYSDSIDQVVENTRDCFAAGYFALEPMRKYNATCHTTGHPLGAHIHGGNINAGPHLFHLLGTAIGVPLRAVTSPDGWRVRLNAGYGNFLNNRAQAWGKEWRTPGACWGKPKYWKAVLGATYSFFEMTTETQGKLWKDCAELIKKLDDFHPGGLIKWFDCPDCAIESRWQYWREAVKLILNSPLAPPCAEILNAFEWGENVTYDNLAQHWEMTRLQKEAKTKKVRVPFNEYLAGRANGSLEVWDPFTERTEYTSEHSLNRRED